jgi:hypothetical protein
VQKFDHIKHMINFKFVHGIEQIMKNIDFNTDFMDDELKNIYNSVKNHYQIDNFYSEYNKLSNHEKLYINLFGNRIIYNSETKLRGYILKQYPIFDNYMSWSSISYTIMEELQLYVKLKEQHMENNK